MPNQAMTADEQEAYDEALKRIVECRSKKLANFWDRLELDLSDLGLTRLPAEVGQLTALALLESDTTN